MTNEEKAEFMADLCADNNCTEDQREDHIRIFLKRKWKVHASRAFRDWWEPTGFAPNGASVGGHTSSRRCWVKKETGERRTYGIGVVRAFNNDHYVQEFHDYLRGGMNPKWHEWNSTTAPEQEMLNIVKQCMEEIKKGVFPVPPVRRLDYKPGQEPDNTHVGGS